MTSPCYFQPVDYYCTAYKCANGACSNTEKPCVFENGICNGSYQHMQFCSPDCCTN